MAKNIKNKISVFRFSQFNHFEQYVFSKSFDQNSFNLSNIGSHE